MPCLLRTGRQRACIGRARGKACAPVGDERASRASQSNGESRAHSGRAGSPSARAACARGPGTPRPRTAWTRGGSSSCPSPSRRPRPGHPGRAAPSCPCVSASSPFSPPLPRRAPPRAGAPSRRAARAPLPPTPGTAPRAPPAAPAPARRALEREAPRGCLAPRCLQGRAPARADGAADQRRRRPGASQHGVCDRRAGVGRASGQ